MRFWYRLKPATRQAVFEAAFTLCASLIAAAILMAGIAGR